MILFIFIWKAERQTNGQREKSPIPWFIPEKIHNQSYTRLKTGAMNSIHITHVGSRDPTTWGNTYCHPRETGSWNWDWSQDSNLGSLIYQCPKDVLTTRPNTYSDISILMVVKILDTFVRMYPLMPIKRGEFYLSIISIYHQLTWNKLPWINIINTKNNSVKLKLRNNNKIIYLSVVSSLLTILLHIVLGRRPWNVFIIS